jgi:hypothetical protein
MYNNSLMDLDTIIRLVIVLLGISSHTLPDFFNVDIIYRQVLRPLLDGASGTR